MESKLAISIAMLRNASSYSGEILVRCLPSGHTKSHLEKQTLDGIFQMNETLDHRNNGWSFFAFLKLSCNFRFDHFMEKT